MQMQRKKALRKELAKAGVKGFLITDPVNLRYLTGFTGSSGFLIITLNKAMFVTDFRYQEQSKDEVKGFRIRIEREERSREIKKIVDEFAIRSLGFEARNISFEFYSNLLKRGIKLKPLTGFVNTLRAVKSADEISNITKAVRRAERAFIGLQPHITVGKTEQFLSLKLGELLRNEGCKKLPFEVIVASGSRSALPHAMPTNKTIKKGDFIVFDWGGEYSGYYSDISRTVLVNGNNVNKKKQLYHNVLEAQKRAIRAVRTGVKASVVDKAARSYIDKLGYGEKFGHGTGHGIGMAGHEEPYISWRSKDLIRNGMVFTVEPGIYLTGFGGVRIEDMVVVGSNGPEMLTGLPRQLKII